MISSLELENFKGVASRQRVEFAPLTLLFGANSAGKSTLLHALLYVHEVLSSGLADVDRTELGGQAVDLGGFRRLVHQHELSRTMRVRVEFDAAGGLNPFQHVFMQSYLHDLDDELRHAWVEIAVSAHGSLPQVERILVGSVGEAEPLLELWPSGTAGVTVAELHISHPLLDSSREGILERLGPEAFQAQDDRLGLLIASRVGTVVPALDESVLIQDDFGDGEQLVEAQHLVEILSVGVLRQLLGQLGRTLYLGPLRAVPPRSFLFERGRSQTSWADGLAAWDALLGDAGPLLEHTNGWLLKLGAGCQVHTQELFDPKADAETASDPGLSTVRRLLLRVGHAGDVLPAEVGTGISQVVPIVVAAVLEDRRPLVLIEQPELHIHPALQVALGDLFIQHCGPRRQFIVETHSEHLILRVLRRIRETTSRQLPDGAPAFDIERLSVLYVDNGPDGALMRRLRVDETGEFTDQWPKGFFDERAEELF